MVGSIEHIYDVVKALTPRICIPYNGITNLHIMVITLREYRFLVLACVIGLLTAVGLYNYLGIIQSRTEVIVAARDIPPHTPIRPEMVRQVMYPSAAVHPATLSHPEEAVGRFAAAPLYRGEPILRPRLVGSGQGTDGIALPDGGRRAMFVPLDPGRYPATFLRPGQVVDIVASVHGPGEAVGPARQILSGVRVLSVITGEARVGDGGGVSGAVVAVDISQAEKLADALDRGRAHLLIAGRVEEPSPASKSGAAGQ